jgi:hypothetical protein
MNFQIIKSCMRMTLLSTGLICTHSIAQTFKPMKLNFVFKKNMENKSQVIQIPEYGTTYVYTQKFLRNEKICLEEGRIDGWISNQKDYFQMNDENKEKFLKNKVKGIDETAPLVVKNCFKSKPRTWNDFVDEVNVCKNKNKKLSTLYMNVVSNYGVENKKNLYPTISQSERCFDQAIYVTALEAREVVIRTIPLKLNVRLANTRNLLSFETEKIDLDLKHGTYKGFYTELANSVYSNYKVTNTTGYYNELNVDLSPTERYKKYVDFSVVPNVYCNGREKRLQREDGANLAKLQEILGPDKSAKMGVSYSDVSGWMNKSVSGSWPYAQFTADELKNGVWFKDITDINVYPGANVKYFLSVVGSKFYEGTLSNVTTCF